LRHLTTTKTILIDFQTLNSILQQAHDGSTVDQWWFYLPSSTDYSVSRFFLLPPCPFDPSFIARDWAGGRWRLYFLLPPSSSLFPFCRPNREKEQSLPFSNYLHFPYPLLNLQRLKLTPLLKAAPQRKPEGGGQEATETPLPSSFKPAFVGKTATEVATWLKNKPDKVDLEGKFFGILDQEAAGKENKVVLCRIGDKEGQGDKVQCVLWSAWKSTLTLGRTESGDFDELIKGNGAYVPEI